MGKKISIAIELTQEQKNAINVIERNTVTSIRGKAGTGKSATTYAYILNKLLNDKTTEVFVAKPPVEAIFNLGFLPGSAEEKTEIYHKVIFHIMKEVFVGNSKDLNGKIKTLERLMKRVHTYDISFLRGITFPSGAIIILDEAQNMPKKGLELLIGRMGKGTKLILIGDENQIDIRNSGFPSWIEVSKITNGAGDVILIENHRDPVALELVENLQKMA